MAEWLKAHAWKACIPQGIQGSNPCLSAIPSHKLLAHLQIFQNKLLGRCAYRVYCAHFARNSRLSPRFYLQKSFGITTDSPPSPKFFLSSIREIPCALLARHSLVPLLHCLVMQFYITI